MEIISWHDCIGNRSFQTTKTAMTIGVFDGLHLGHRKLIEHVVDAAVPLTPVAVTFKTNPRHVLKGPGAKKGIITQELKLEIFESLGVKLTVMIDFSLKFSRMDAKTFFRTLSSVFQIKKIVVGRNFRFGKHREAGGKALEKMCSEIGAFLDIVETVRFRNLPVSSTRIRHAVSEGNFDDVRMMLLRDYVVVIDKAAPARRQGHWLAVARDDIHQIVPLHGSYRCRMETATGSGMGIVRLEHDMLYAECAGAPPERICFLEKAHGRP